MRVAQALAGALAAVVAAGAQAHGCGDALGGPDPESLCREVLARERPSPAEQALREHTETLGGTRSPWAEIAMAPMRESGPETLDDAAHEAAVAAELARRRTTVAPTAYTACDGHTGVCWRTTEARWRQDWLQHRARSGRGTL